MHFAKLNAICEGWEGIHIVTCKNSQKENEAES